MKATGEVMSIGRTLEESLLKAVRSLEIGVCHLELSKLKEMTRYELVELILKSTDERFFAIAEAFRKEITLDYIYSLTKIDRLFLEKVLNIVNFEKVIKENISNTDILRRAKKRGFSDEYIAGCWNMDLTEIFKIRKENGFMPVYKMIDTCAGI